MIDHVVVDFQKTFGSKGIYLGLQPKMTREDKANPKSKMVQATDKDGVLKWTVSIAVKTQAFEKTKNENIEVTIGSSQEPYKAIPEGTPVIIENLVAGFMKQERGGYSIFWSAENIRPLQPVQPTQPARMASSQ